MIYFTFFHTKFLKSGVYLFHTDSLSQFRLASLETLPVTWPVAATLDRPHKWRCQAPFSAALVALRVRPFKDLTTDLKRLASYPGITFIILSFKTSPCSAAE